MRVIVCGEIISKCPLKPTKLLLRHTAIGFSAARLYVQCVPNSCCFVVLHQSKNKCTAVLTVAACPYLEKKKIAVVKFDKLTVKNVLLQELVAKLL